MADRLESHFSSTDAVDIVVVDVHKAELVKRGYRDFADWAARPNHIYVGRNMSFYVPGAHGSKWANPFTVKKYGRD